MISNDYLKLSQGTKLRFLNFQVWQNISYLKIHEFSRNKVCDVLMFVRKIQEHTEEEHFYQILVLKTHFILVQ